jgi:lipopolysaccharide transport system permease protein
MESRANNTINSLFSTVWAFRGYIVSSVRREFQIRYRNSLLGAAWNVLNPLTMIIVYTVIFSQLMRARLPGVDGSFGYSIYLCAGLITWGLFSEILLRSQNVFLENANLIKKLNFPRLCLPIIVVLNAWVNFVIIFALLLLFLILTNHFPGWPLLAMLPILFIQTAFAIGLGMTVGVLNVFFRDVGHLVGIVLQFWFWFTPIIYPLTTLPEWARGFVQLNPMTPAVAAYQTILLNGSWPQWLSLWPAALCSVIACALGLTLFRNHASEMVDEL